jgi:hypothetical protein
VAKKKVVAASVSSTEAFPMAGLALQLEVPTMAASIPGLKVGEECWSSGLDARLAAGGGGGQYPTGSGGGGHIKVCPTAGDPPHDIMCVGPI